MRWNSNNSVHLHGYPPLWGLIMTLPSFCYFAPKPLLFPKCLHQCPYFVYKKGAMVQNENKGGNTNSKVSKWGQPCNCTLTIQPFAELHYTSVCKENTLKENFAVAHSTYVKFAVGHWNIFSLLWDTNFFAVAHRPVCLGQRKKC